MPVRNNTTESVDRVSESMRIDREIRHRGRERVRRVALTGVSSLSARGMSFITFLVSIPITVDYLGAEQFGLWVAISSVSAFLGGSDLGIGNGVVNLVAEAKVRRDHSAIRRYASNAFFGLCLVALCFGIVFIISTQFVPWAAIFNASSPQVAHEAAPAVAAFVGITLLALPFGVAQQVFAGHQEGYVPGIASALANLLALGFIVGAVSLEASMPILVVALSSARLTEGLLSTFACFWIKHPVVRPKWHDFGWSGFSQLLHLGSLFLVIQLVGAFAYEADSLIIANVLGLDAVAEYSVPLRLSGIVILFSGFLLKPLWPAYRESTTSGDSQWAAVTFRTSVILSAGVALLAGTVVLTAGGVIVHAWVPAINPPDQRLLVALALWIFVANIGGAYAMFLCGMNVIRFQAVCGAVSLLVNIPLSIVLTHRIGVSGVLWGSIVAQVTCILGPATIVIYRTLRQLRCDIAV